MRKAFSSADGTFSFCTTLAVFLFRLVSLGGSKLDWLAGKKLLGSLVENVVGSLVHCLDLWLTDLLAGW